MGVQVRAPVTKTTATIAIAFQNENLRRNATMSTGTGHHDSQLEYLGKNVRSF